MSVLMYRVFSFIFNSTVMFGKITWAPIAEYWNLVKKNNQTIEGNWAFLKNISAPNISLGVTQKTGTIVTFEKEAIYNTTISPGVGNITSNLTGAILGITNEIIHNSNVAPTFDDNFHKLSGSGDYVTGVVNYIFCSLSDITNSIIVYTISQ